MKREKANADGQLVGVLASMDAGVLQVRAVPGAVHIVMPGPAGRTHDGRRIDSVRTSRARLDASEAGDVAHPDAADAGLCCELEAGGLASCPDPSRVNSAHEAMKATAALVDDTKLPRLGPDKSWTEWFGRTVSPALRALALDGRIAKLLPPAASKTVDEAEGKKA